MSDVRATIISRVQGHIKQLEKQRQRAFLARDFIHDEQKWSFTMNNSISPLETDLCAETIEIYPRIHGFAKMSAGDLKRRIDALRLSGQSLNKMPTSQTNFLNEIEELIYSLSTIERHQQRIDASFEQLNRYLDEIKDAYAFVDQAVQSSDNERVFMELLMLSQTLNTMAKTWKDLRYETEFGSHAVQLESQLAILEECVQDAYAAMGALSFDIFERQIFTLNIKGISISVSDLFDWILAFSQTKVSFSLNNGDKLALAMMLSEARQLHDLVATLAKINKDTSSPLEHPRVRNAITNVERCLLNVLITLQKG
jgi:hypothetical protein